MNASSTPNLSVVIPTHNTRTLTDEAIGSICGQAVPACEIIVVDDGSSDGTAQWLADHRPSVTVLRNDEPSGFSASANRGLSHAEGQILLLLNSDTVLAADALQPMLEAFENNRDLGIAGAVLQYPDGSPQWSGGKFPSHTWLFALTSGVADLAGALPLYRRFKKPGTRAIGPVQWVTGAAMAIRRSVWDNIGPLDEGYRFYGQDLDLCRKTSQAGWNIALIPGFVVTHYHGATIGKNAGATVSAHPEYLWTDILRFINLNDGPQAGHRARLVMRAGARLRVGAMKLALPFGSLRTRKTRRERRAVYLKAMEGLNRTVD